MLRPTCTIRNLGNSHYNSRTSAYPGPKQSGCQAPICRPLRYTVRIDRIIAAIQIYMVAPLKNVILCLIAPS
ncbi:hypothetical protein BU23DRAFT_560390 [Bimuria novae-zelandiae CBS 107.79]|uniref:Uncharacterized protein n=1 Tax=Bimuria novae-zelandiae CBS 107.79 TaxID=1447943 RepID=A0A6A5UNI2_9PLEO|nr:hypothetical protein BU23DRAFT_560390 [Bimuria novae-zelandiae CBS 107.79]